MALRVRSDGRILCAAMHPALPDDRAYIDDGIHYKLSAENAALVTEEMHANAGRGGHAKHGEWWWRNEVPDDVVVAPFYTRQWGAAPIPAPLGSRLEGMNRNAVVIIVVAILVALLA